MNIVIKKVIRNKLLTMVVSVFMCLGVALLDVLTPPSVPTEALYALPIWLGLVALGLAGGLSLATFVTLLFYISNYLIAHDSMQDIGLAIVLTYILFVVYTYGAYHFLLNQRQLEQLRQDLQVKLAELDKLYQASQQLHQQNLKLAIIDERNRLAREIHDVLAQGLAAIIFQVEAAYMHRNDQELLEKNFFYISEIAHQNLQEARRSVANLRPLPLDSTTLQEALQYRIDEFKTTYPSITASFMLTGVIHELKSEVENAIYRIAQEALNNVIRHAEASEINVMLDYDEEEVCLTVQDNGRGFDADTKKGLDWEWEKPAQKGFGLNTMQERASLIGGLVTITTQPGAGCRLRVIVPYHKGSVDKILPENETDSRAATLLT